MENAGLLYTHARIGLGTSQHLSQVAEVYVSLSRLTTVKANCAVCRDIPGRQARKPEVRQSTKQLRYPCPGAAIGGFATQLPPGYGVEPLHGNNP